MAIGFANGQHRASLSLALQMTDAHGLDRPLNPSKRLSSTHLHQMDLVIGYRSISPPCHAQDDENYGVIKELPVRPCRRP